MKKGLFVLASLLAISSFASATIQTYDMGYTWNGTDPSLAGPWLTASFDDGGTSGDVLLTVTAGNLAPSTDEKVKTLYLNLDPALDLNALSFSGETVTQGAFTLPTYSKDVDGGGTRLDTNPFKADGDGYFDIMIEFEVNDMLNTFNAGDELQLTISGTGLLADSFHFESLPNGGNGEYIIATHILGIDDGAGSTISGWVTIPEPTTIMLLGLGGLLLRRKKK